MTFLRSPRVRTTPISWLHAQTHTHTDRYILYNINPSRPRATKYDDRRLLPRDRVAYAVYLTYYTYIILYKNGIFSNVIISSRDVH